MSLESVKEYFNKANLDLEVIELKENSATVELAARALGVEAGRIAKTMAFQVNDDTVLILTKGDARIDNSKFKQYFNVKAKMVRFEEVFAVTGHPVGGVCPFGLKNPLSVYLDKTLKEFDYVFPAGGSPNSAVKITTAQLAEVTQGKWVDVCKID